MSTTEQRAALGGILADRQLFHEACYIDGQWVGSESGERIGVDNPATQQIIGTVPSLTAAETRGAIDAAHRAFSPWRAATAKERAGILRKWFDLMMANQE